MRITHCWDIEYEKAEAIAATYGCTAVKNFDDMLGKVDGVISGGYYNHPWNHILHEPYLEAGLPNLINRPFANSLVKAKRMTELAEKSGATILVPSSHEHNDAISRAKAWASDKQVICYTATNSFDDYPTHGVHGVYMVFKAIAEAGNPVVSVAYRADSWHSPPGVITFEHVDSDGRQFFGTLHQVSGSWGTVQIHTQEALVARILESTPVLATRSTKPKSGYQRFGRSRTWHSITRCHRRSIQILHKRTSSLRVGNRS